MPVFQSNNKEKKLCATPKAHPNIMKEKEINMLSRRQIRQGFPEGQSRSELAL